MGLGLLVPGALALTGVPAAARPRDDAMSGAFRCGAIGDTRTWLDCYYGAAQPVRAALGLKPVPATQSQLVARPPAGTPPAGEQALRDQVMAGAVRCSTLQDRQWLDCYYASAQPVRAHLGLSGGAQVSPPIQPLAAAAPSQFGLAPKPAAPLDGADRIASSMASYSFDKLGWFTVTLENGQVWKQVNGDTTYAHWNKPAPRYLVRVSHGFLGSFNLQVQGEPGLFKVRRVQ